MGGLEVVTIDDLDLAKIEVFHGKLDRGVDEDSKNIDDEIMSHRECGWLDDYGKEQSVTAGSSL